MFGRASHLIKQINDLILELQNIKNLELDEKKKQLHTIIESIGNIERTGIPVPKDLINLQKQLQSEINKFDNPDDVLQFLADEMYKLIAKIKKSGISSIDDLKTNRSYKGRIDRTTPITPQETLKRTLLSVLTDLGGSAEMNSILDKMEIKLKNQLTQADKEMVGYGIERWKNKVQWLRFHLIKQGIMKKNSPRGIWELSGKK